jgi:hypothetical protein
MTKRQRLASSVEGAADEARGDEGTLARAQQVIKADDLVIRVERPLPPSGIQFASQLPSGSRHQRSRLPSCCEAPTPSTRTRRTRGAARAHRRGACEYRACRGDARQAETGSQPKRQRGRVARTLGLQEGHLMAKDIEILPRRSLVKTLPLSEPAPVAKPKHLRARRHLSPEFAKAIAELEFAVGRRRR